jgi:hypothetical protein
MASDGSPHRAVLHRRQSVRKLLNAALADGWSSSMHEAKRLAELARLEREGASLEAQLRRARHEAHQASLVNLAHEDEIRALRDKLAELGGAMGDGANVKSTLEELR